MRKLKLEFSSHTANLSLMRNAVRKFLDGYDFSEKERVLMVLGVDEACTNIIRYAYGLRDDQCISISMESLRKTIRVRLRDYGRRLPRNLKVRAPDVVRPGGLGLHLICTAFDKVEYISRRRGTELLLTKKLR
jgi:serine/threonine-protein kinase RsbW